MAPSFCMEPNRLIAKTSKIQKCLKFSMTKASNFISSKLSICFKMKNEITLQQGEGKEAYSLVRLQSCTISSNLGATHLFFKSCSLQKNAG